MSNAVEALLTRLKMPEAIPKFKEMNVDRIVNLRRLSEQDICKAVPDTEKRKQLLEAINSRGTHDKRAHQNVGNVNPPRNLDDAGRGAPRPPPHNNSMRGGGGGGGNRGGGRAQGDRRGDSPSYSARQNQACRHYFKGECKYGDKCHFSHEQEVFEKEQAEGGPRRRPEDIGNTEDFSEVCEIPTSCIKFLLGKKHQLLKEINHECKTHNKSFSHIDESIKKFELILYGSQPEHVKKAKEKILALVGAKREEEKKSRLHYTLNELSSNHHAVKLLAACNMKNEGSALELSENSLKSIISSFRFEKQQDVRHFWVNTTNDRHKLETIAKIVAQLRGVQAIMFCDQKRVVDFGKSSAKISRHFNGVNPVFIHRALSKEERFGFMEEFKDGEENESGIRERLMVTSEDYAKLARKTTIPYVNLVINYTLPRSEEFYQLQSHVAGRNDTVGVSILCVAPYDVPSFQRLQQNIPFEPLDDECNITDTALQMVYDTVANPLTSEDADPPKNWREKLIAVQSGENN